jgi:hypothetical protein
MPGKRKSERTPGQPDGKKMGVVRLLDLGGGGLTIKTSTKKSQKCAK